MTKEALKLELIEWLSQLDDDETIEYLKVVKDSRSSNKDWWNELTDKQKQGIERGLKDIEHGRTVPHEEVKKKYGL
jgi:predicted transcriptional regulator